MKSAVEMVANITVFILPVLLAPNYAGKASSPNDSACGSLRVREILCQAASRMTPFGGHVAWPSNCIRLSARLATSALPTSAWRERAESQPLQPLS